MAQEDEWKPFIPFVIFVLKIYLWISCREHLERLNFMLQSWTMLVISLSTCETKLINWWRNLLMWFCSQFYLETSELSNYWFEFYILFNRFQSENLFSIFKITLSPKVIMYVSLMDLQHLYKWKRLLNALGNKNIPPLFVLFFDVSETFRKTFIIVEIWKLLVSVQITLVYIGKL